jgi:RNA polymerase sigma-70 factor, ECF subfamily
MIKTFSSSYSGLLNPVTSEPKLSGVSAQDDQDAFASLYDTCVARIHRYIYYRVADDQLAEDITSKVFLKVWEKLPTYQPGKSPILAWIYRIAHNAVIDHYRTKKVSVPLEQVDPAEISWEDGTDKKMDLQIESQQLYEAIQELTAEQQQVLILKFIHGFSTREIAEQLGKQQGAVRALQMRGLREMAKRPGLQREQLYAQ